MTVVLLNGNWKIKLKNPVNNCLSFNAGLTLGILQLTLVNGVMLKPFANIRRKI